MQINLLKNLIEKVAGSVAVPIVEILYSKRDVNEFLIAKKMNMTINQVRNILYKLSAEGLVSFIRKKDKRKGWYIYFWTLDSYKCLLKIQADLQNDVRDLELLLESREKNRFYVCKTCNIEINEEKALEHDFSCEECADLYQLADNTPIIKDLKNKIARKNRSLATVQEEIKVMEEEENRKKAIKQKKYEKEKLAEKERKKAERKKQKELLKKKPSKKSAKEKSSKKSKQSSSKVSKKTSRIKISKAKVSKSKISKKRSRK